MIRAEGPVKTLLHPEQKSNKIEYYLFRLITCLSYVLMISLDLMKSSEVRIAGDEPISQ